MPHSPSIVLKLIMKITTIDIGVLDNCLNFCYTPFGHVVRLLFCKNPSNIRPPDY